AGPVVEAGLGLAGADVLHPVGGAFAGAGVAVDVVGAGVEGAVGILGVALVEGQFGAVAVLGGLHGGFGVIGRLRILALEQRVLLELGLDEGVQLEVRQLQQLDRLLQLGRDDQPLPLPYL